MMWENVNNAIKADNFTQAEQLLQEFDDENDNVLWKKYYQARIEEAQENWQTAEQYYRQIIKDSIFPDPQLMAQVREGIKRVLVGKKNQKTLEKEKFVNNENSNKLAFLVLKSVSLAEKKLLAPQFAKTMEIDRYTATLQIPTRSWRLYRIGTYGELNYFYNQLVKADIPCICKTIEQINTVNVYRVKFIQSASSELILVGETEREKETEITINWADINQRLEAMIPIFESTVHIDAKGKMQKKESTLDYAQFLDLHVHKLNLIVRLNDHNYQFEQGVDFTQDTQTNQEKWKNLTNLFNQKIQEIINNKNTHIPLYNDFKSFAEGAVQFPDMLKQIDSHVHLFHRQDNFWDNAFQLYSSLLFLQNDNE